MTHDEIEFIEISPNNDDPNTATDLNKAPLHILPPGPIAEYIPSREALHYGPITVAKECLICDLEKAFGISKEDLEGDAPRSGVGVLMGVDPGDPDGDKTVRYRLTRRSPKDT